MYTATTPLCLRHRDVNREDIAEMSQTKTRRSRNRNPVRPPTKGSRKKMYCETEDEHTSPMKKNLYVEVYPSSPYPDVRISEEKSPHTFPHCVGLPSSCFVSTCCYNEHHRG
jgi:hypothetical protein